MKIRTGFVSNSSSASFVINWECHIVKDGIKLNSKDAICQLFSFEDDDIEHNQYVADIINGATTNTVEHRPGVFTTNFHTSMLNFPCDFGNDAAQFFFALSQKVALDGRAEFEIVSTKIDADY